MRAPIPENETQRLQALKDYAVLDTPSERAYDDITTLAAHICGVPIAIVSLIDTDRQWFKSKVGLDASETPRDVAFCAHAILQDDLLIVPDAALDARFARNPLVTSAPHIRFYAGAPLITREGLKLGTLCAIDRRPRALSADQSEALQALARQVMAYLELRLVSARLAAALEKIRRIEGLIPICAYCKSIRDDKGYWAELERFMEENLAAELTHGICPACLKTHFGMDPEPGSDLRQAAPKR